MKAIEKLQSLVGQDAVKETLMHEIVEIKHSMQNANGFSLNLNYVFTGNPGTGKTTVARLFCDCLFEEGILPTNNFIEVSRQDLIGQYIGETSKKTREVCEKALGGMLVIDEAYALYNDSSSSFSHEALYTILSFIEEHKGKLALILIGYKNEMCNFLEINAGFKARIKKNIEFSDYSNEELVVIFNNEIRKRNLCANAGISDLILDYFESIKRDRSFGNARIVQNLAHTVIGNSMLRTSRMNDDNITQEQTITKDDLPVIGVGFSCPCEIIQKINGQDQIKQAFLEEINRIKYLQQNNNYYFINYLFTGNHGKEKTIFAKLFCDCLFEEGILPTNNFIEVSKHDLVSEYVGHTSKKTREVCEKALGGMLIIDEAYTLNDQDFGLEALFTIIKFIHDNQNKIALVLSGYENEMQELLENHPALKNRLNSKTFNFKK